MVVKREQRVKPRWLHVARCRRVVWQDVAVVRKVTRIVAMYTSLLFSNSSLVAKEI
jgi:hypothetical protein